jgi:hypothetical protein
MKRTLVPILTALVPVLGLFSCSKDKPTEDSWRLSEPVIESSSLPPQPVTSASLQNLPGDSELVLRSDETSGGTITINSKCRSKLGESTAKSTLKNPNRISLKGLWPLAMFLNLTSEELKQSRCDFDFEMVNEIGSVHAFTMASVRLIEFTSKTATELPKPVTRESLENFDSANLNNFESKSVSYILCENFANSLMLNKTAFIEEGDLLKKLLFGPIQNPISSRKSAVDPRVSQTEQNCRLLSINPAKAGANSSIFLSEDFQVRFPAPTLRTEVTWPIRNANRESGTKLVVFDIALKNISDAPTAIRVSDAVNQIRWQFLLKAKHVWQVHDNSDNLYLASKLNEDKFNIEISGGSGNWRKNDKRVFELAPSETVHVRGVIETFCFSMIFYASPDVKPPYNDPTSYAEQGFFFDLSNAFSIEQFYSWNHAKPNFEGGMNDVSPIELKPANSAYPQTFVPLEAYYRTYSDFGAAPLGDLPTIPEEANELSMGCHFARAGKITL